MWKEIALEKDDRGYLRTKIQLEDGIYQYKFRIQSQSPCCEADEWVEVNDPYATEIDRTTNTSTIRIKAGARIIDSYVWQHDDKKLPENEELVIYELHVADFSGADGSDSGGKFQQAIEKLDYLCDLGINAIELMPVNEYPGDYSWGYKVRDFFAVESSYGATADLKQLIDECHGRSIRAILDGIYNHCDEECPLLLIDRNYWYYRDKHYPEDHANYWGPEFNCDNFDSKLGIRPAWKFIGDVVNFWIQEYHIDGIRRRCSAAVGQSRFPALDNSRSEKNRLRQAILQHSRTHSRTYRTRGCGRADGRLLARKFSHFCHRKSRGGSFRSRKAQASCGCQTARLSKNN
ncbi:alpha-amylase family glycosyl hydrolase [Microcoleus sp. MOSTC5]|uniref:alpha-amylase family glycosyl hydrolase n=1 Tax=Microcoleus sp. MOSTC5 TaxID=3055378 RepID=UPI004040B39B